MTNGPSQAMNLGGAPNAYGDSFIPLDLVKGLSGWEYWTGTEAIPLPSSSLRLDAKGWVKDLPIINGYPHEIFANVFYGKVLGPTQYIMEWKGEGSIRVDEDYTVIGDNKILINFTPDYTDAAGNPQEDGLTIILSETDPDNTGNHIRDIKVYRLEDADLIAAGEHFNPDWFDRIDDFRILRTHDWQWTNFPSSVDWTRNNQTADQARWAADGLGMPYELIVEIANQTRSDLWINIPHTASDTYIRSAAAYVKAHLNPDLQVMIEFSNEYWTTIFNQYQYFIDGGAAAFGSADFAAGQFYATRAAHMTDLFQQEFGASASRLRPTLTVDNIMFNTGEAEVMLTAPAHIAAGGQAPLDKGFEVIATDGYLSWWGPDPGTAAMIKGWMAQPDQGFGAARDFLLNQLYTELLPSWQKGRALADKYGLEFMVYEGGTLLLNQVPNPDPVITDFALRFTKSTELKAVYEATLAAWATVGTGPFAWYADVGRPGPWGDYGHWKGITFTPDPRTDVITDAKATLPPWWSTGDTRPDSFFDNGLYDAGTAGADNMPGTALADRLYGLTGQDRLSGLAGNDRLWGGDNGDVLDGGLGADELNGGAGRDWANYNGSAFGVQVNLAKGRGTGGDAAGDRLTQIENLRGSAFNDRLTGDQHANTLFGRAGNDTLKGGLGQDRLSGGLGDDVFVFAFLAEAGDTITDFNARGNDTIRLSAAAFGNHAKGALTNLEFQSGPGHAATTRDIRILHDKATGTIWFDADGSGATEAVLLAHVQTQAIIGVQDFWFF